jgi:uncharacterized membrane protein
MIKKFFSPLSWIQSAKLFWFLYASMGCIWIGYAFITYFLCGHTEDISLQTQPVVNAAVHGKYWNTLFDGHPFSNHFRPGLLVFYPFIKLFPMVPYTLWPIVAKSISFMVSPLLLLKLGRKVLPDQRWIFAIPLLWLLSDVLMRPMTTPNYASSLLFAPIIGAFYFAYVGRLKWVYVLVFVMTLFKENMPLIGVCLAMFLIVEKQQWRQGLALGLVSIVLGLSALTIMNQFGFSVTQGHGVSGLSIFYQFDWKVTMVTKLVIGAGLIPFIAPKTLLYQLPATAVYWLMYTDEKKFFFTNGHHHDYTMTIMMVCALFALRHSIEGKSWILKKPSRVRTVLASLLVVGIGVSGITNLPKLLVMNTSTDESYSIQDRYKTYVQIRQIKKQIPLSATVAATHYTTGFFLGHRQVHNIAYSQLDDNQFADDFTVFPLEAKVSGYRGEYYRKVKQVLQKKIQNGTLKQHPYSTEKIAVYTPVYSL